MTWSNGLIDPYALFGALLLILVAVYPSRYVGTKARTDLPGPRGYPLLGNMPQVFPWRKATIQWMQLMQRQYGDLWTFTMPPWGRAIVINRPEWLAHVKAHDMRTYTRGPAAVAIFSEFPGKRTTAASDGAGWRLARKTMSGLFTVQSFNDHVHPSLNEVIPTVRDLLSAAADTERPLDWNDLSGRIALAIFHKSALGLGTKVLRSDLACLEESDTLRDALIVLNHISSRRLMNPFWRWTDKITPSGRQFAQARNDVWRVIHDLINARRKERTNGMINDADYLSALLNDAGESDPLFIRDILVTLLFAGRDNIQNALAWSLLSLCKHPEWLDKMRSEASKHHREGQEILYNDMPKYAIHQAVFYETVRLWPGIPKNARLALHDDILPALPEVGLPSVKVSRGDYVFWSDFSLLRHPEIWGDDAAVFNPGRHLDENGQFVKPQAPNFAGFGAGPRLCPAAQLATYEFVACWAGLVRFFDFQFVGTEEPSMVEAFTPAMSGSLMVSVRHLVQL